MIAMNDNDRDISCELGALYPHIGEPEIPMFSFVRPSQILWQEVFHILTHGGWCEEDAIAWLQSKGPRHMLDGAATGWLKEVAYKIAQCADRAYIG